MFEFQPAISRPASFIEFPRPVTSFRVLDSWDFQQMKVPLQPGDQVEGHSKNGVSISLEGQIGSHSGTLKLSEEEMLSTLDTIRTVLDVNQVSGKFVLVLFEDLQSDQFRYFQKCTTSRFEFDFSSKHIYSYAATIHASDPTLYSGSLPV